MRVSAYPRPGFIWWSALFRGAQTVPGGKVFLSRSTIFAWGETLSRPLPKTKPNQTKPNPKKSRKHRETECFYNVPSNPANVRTTFSCPTHFLSKYLNGRKTYCMFKSVFCNAGSRCAIAFYIYTAAVIAGDRVTAGE